MAIEFSSVAMPITVPGAAEALGVLEKLDARGQKAAQDVSKSFLGLESAAASAGIATQAMMEGLEKSSQRAGRAAREHVGESLEEVSVVTERTANRLEHLGVSGSFAMTSLATGGEQGLTRFAHSLATFGGSFGPAGLMVTTFVAVAGEKLIQWLIETRKEVKETQAAFDTGIAKMVEGTNVEALVGRFGKLPKLRGGDGVAALLSRGPSEEDVKAMKELGVFVKDEDLAHLARLEGSVGVLKHQRELEKEIADIKEPFSAETGLPTIHYRHLNTELTKTKDLVVQLGQAYETAAKASKVVVEDAVGKTDAAIKNAAYRREETAAAKAQYESEMEAARGLLDEQMRITDARLAYLKTAGPKEHDAYVELLGKRAAMEREFDEKAKALKKELANKLFEIVTGEYDMEMAAAGKDLELRAQAQDRYIAKLKTISDLDIKHIAAANERKVALDAETTAKLTATDRLRADIRLATAKDNAKEELRIAQQLAADLLATKGAADEEYLRAELRVEMLVLQLKLKEKAKAEQLARETGQLMESVLSSTFKHGGGLAGGARELGDQLLSAFGGILMRQGEALIAASPIFMGIATMLSNPITAGEGSLMWGSALLALGAALGAAAHGGGSSGGGRASAGISAGSGYHQTMTVSPSSSPNMAGLTAPTPVQNHFTIIGKDDPRVQREILELLDRAGRRGTTNG